ncbi:glycosyltransferase family 2 protein [Sphingobacterium corticibacterium]|uniref:Glycosyltransferase family 2 protein n=1 Tax=Sphingobacterium corticibacterium TaxID=2484746 RepID=A0A4V2DCJ2_9SPHI|nr:glycosyltransferase family 2 protein [Sphingobacterium corticibacterium]RZF61678.1 glycosyltransferase family 2 protein [Sphingobacterium corticibacterium]
MIYVSFVLPAYKAKFLKQAIDSILHQRYTNFELIIVDDASPENLKEIVDRYTDERISYYRNEKNLGGRNLVDQWNHCIQYANGEYIVLAADDDLYHEDYLQQCVALAQKYPDVDLIRARVAQIDEENQLIGIDGILPEFTSKYQYLHYWFAGVAFTCIGNYMFKAKPLKESQFINFPSAFCSDAATAIMMAEQGVANTAEMLFSFRISTIHLSSSRKHLKEKLHANTQFYKWLFALRYDKPKDPLDLYCYHRIAHHHIYNKCVYDYYNQVIKFLPVSKLGYMKYCTLLSAKDKKKMVLRYFFDKIFKR